eukprot:7307569-Pyramimonas_sp.AAC.1
MNPLLGIPLYICSNFPPSTPPLLRVVSAPRSKGDPAQMLSSIYSRVSRPRACQRAKTVAELIRHIVDAWTNAGPSLQRGATQSNA